MIKLSSVFLFLLLLSSFAGASLGISPAYFSVDFEPGASYSYTFLISSDDSTRPLDLYVEGDFAQYARLSKDSLPGADYFNMTLTFPDSVDVPGTHSLYVHAKEKVPEGEFLGSQIDIGALIKIFVPYPGRYAILGLSIPNGNINENVPINLLVSNKGDDTLVIDDAKVDFFVNDELVRTLSFNSLNIESTKEHTFKGYFNSTGIRAGVYYALASVSAGETWTANTTFKLGSLAFNVTNFTRKLYSKGIQKMQIDVESLWNNPLSGVYADVSITGVADKNLSFKTPSTDFDSWEIKTLEGFVDTTDLIGEYPVEIVLHFSNQNYTLLSTVTVVSRINYLVFVIPGALIIILAVVYFIIRKRRSKK